LESIESLAKTTLEAEAACIVLARRDPSFFVSYVMEDPQTGWNFEQEFIHREGHELITAIRFAAIEWPREHGKTEQYVIGRTIYKMGMNPNRRIKIVSNTDGEALKRVSAVGDHIVDNPKVKLVFPNMIPDFKKGWTKSQLFLKRTIKGIKDPTLEGYGIMSSATGGRADDLIFDDVCDFENTIKNPALMPKVIEAYQNKWLNLLTKDGNINYVFTRWHEKDLSHHLIRSQFIPWKPGMTNADIPDEKYGYVKHVIDEKKLEPISIQWPKKRLIARRGSIGKRAFARNFCGKAMTTDEALFGEIEKYIDWDRERIEIPQFPRFTGVDVGHRAAMEGSEFAYSAIFTGVITPDHKKIPLDIERGRWKSSVTADRLIAHVLRNKSELVLVENNGAQQMLVEWTQEKMQKRGISFPIKGYFTGKQKMDEEIGLPGMSVDMEMGNWIIPMGDGRSHGRDGDTCDCLFCIWIDEMKAWPVGDFFDIGMASWLFFQCVKNFRRGSGIVTAGKRETGNQLKEFGANGNFRKDIINSLR